MRMGGTHVEAVIASSVNSSLNVERGKNHAKPVNGVIAPFGMLARYLLCIRVCGGGDRPRKRSTTKGTDMKARLRALVTGSREYTDHRQIHDVLRRLAPGSIVVHGGAKGADRLCRDTALGLGLTVEEHLPDWKGLGRSAGFKRNALMVKLGADRCYAFFSNPESKGTQHTVDLAIKAGIKTVSFGNVQQEQQLSFI